MCIRDRSCTCTSRPPSRPAATGSGRPARARAGRRSYLRAATAAPGRRTVARTPAGQPSRSRAPAAPDRRRRRTAGAACRRRRGRAPTPSVPGPPAPRQGPGRASVPRREPPRCRGRPALLSRHVLRRPSGLRRRGRRPSRSRPSRSRPSRSRPSRSRPSRAPGRLLRPGWVQVGQPQARQHVPVLRRGGDDSSGCRRVRRWHRRRAAGLAHAGAPVAVRPGPSPGAAADRGLDWAGFDWAGFDWAGFDWAGFDWAGFDWAGFDWAGDRAGGAHWAGGARGVRVGLVCPYTWEVPGGVQSHVRDLAEALADLGHSVSVLAPADDDTPLPPYVSSAGRALPVPYNGSVARLAFGPLSAARVRRWLREGSFDVLHVHEPAAPSLSLLACWAADGPIVATFHTANPRSRVMAAAQAALQPAMEKITGRIAVSSAARRTVVEHLGADAVLIPNGVSVAAFRGARPLLGWPGAGGAVGFLGRFDEPRKGFNVLLTAFAVLASHRPGLRLLVAGRGDAAEKAH